MQDAGNRRQQLHTRIQYSSSLFVIDSVLTIWDHAPAFVELLHYPGKAKNFELDCGDEMAIF